VKSAPELKAACLVKAITGQSLVKTVETACTIVAGRRIREVDLLQLGVSENNKQQIMWKTVNFCKALDEKPLFSTLYRR
jgi:hypothetical protein